MVSEIPLSDGARGPFRDRVEHGQHPYGRAFFDSQVVSKYRDQQEKYDFVDDVMEGWVATNDAYYFSLPEDTRDEETFGQVRYGKRQLAGGGVAIAAILRDLADLPYKEQLYWRSFELDDPAFAEDDLSFHKFLRQDYGGEFVDHEDPIERVYAAIASVNDKIESGQLFRIINRNPHLSYPARNNRKAYSQAHNELRKVIGADSLDAKVIKRLLQTLAVSYPEDAKPWSLFKTLVGRVCDEPRDRILEPFERNAKQRSLDAHEIDPLEIEKEDFVGRFKWDCLDVVKALKEFEAALASTMEQAGHPTSPVDPWAPGRK